MHREGERAFLLANGIICPSRILFFVSRTVIDEEVQMIQSDYLQYAATSMIIKFKCMRQLHCCVSVKIKL